MTVIVLATTASGLLVSKILLEAGLTNVLIRYPLSVVGAYLAFLGMARLWSSYVLRRGEAGAFDWLDLLDGGSWPERSGADAFGGGGSGGAGASGSWEPAAIHDGGIDLDLGELAVVVIVFIGLMMVVLGAGIYVIYWAPEILPEVAFNVALASCLTGAAKKAQSKAWIFGVARSTRIALAMVLVTSFGFSLALRHECPGAAKLTDVRSCVPARRTHVDQSPR